jgi:iron complex transport system substrate-binding protein
VCAVSYDDVLEAARRLAHADVTVVSVHPTRLGDIWSDVRRIAEALGREDEARELLADMDRRVSDVEQRAGSWLRRSGATPPRVLSLEWIDPPMVGGTWMPELIERAGGVPLVARPGERAPTLTPEQLAALDPPPEVVVVKPCGFTLPRIVSEADRLSELLMELGWPAVRDRRVWIADGNAYFNRSGPRIVDSLEILAACLHPGAFDDVAHRCEGAFRRFGVRGSRGRP